MASSSIIRMADHGCYPWSLLSSFPSLHTFKELSYQRYTLPQEETFPKDHSKKGHIDNSSTININQSKCFARLHPVSPLPFIRQGICTTFPNLVGVQSVLQRRTARHSQWQDNQPLHRHRVSDLFLFPLARAPSPSSSAI